MSPSRHDRRAPGGQGLRVGYVLKKFPRTSETFVVDEVLGLEEAGVEVEVLSLRPPDGGKFHSDLGRLRAEVRYLPPFGSASALDAVRTLARLGAAAHPSLGRALRFLDRVAPERRAPLLFQALDLSGLALALDLDHLHAHFMTVAAHTAYLAHLLTGMPFSVTAHAKDVYRQAVDPAVFAEVAGAASAVVTVCEANRRYIRERLAPGSGRVVRIYNGLDLRRVQPGTVPRDPRLVLGVGRLVAKKGFHVLLEACALLAAREVPFRCVVLGDGEERGPLAERLDRLGLADRVRLAGPATRDEVLRWMRRARVLAAPCLRGPDGNQDALPTVLLEALAVGLPVVSTPVGGIPEILDPGVEGLLVPEGDPEALAGAIGRLLEDEPTWARLSAAGPARVAARFDRRRSTEELVRIFAGSARKAGLPAGSAR